MRDRCLLLLAAVVLATAAPDASARTALVPSRDGDSRNAVIADNGRFVAFDSDATNVAHDRNGAVRDVFRADLSGNRPELLSVAFDGAGTDRASSNPAISADGKVVAYESNATNILPGDANGERDVFATAEGVTVLVSIGAGGEPANGPSTQPDLSADGTRVVFTSRASNLVPNDTNKVADVFVRDLVRQTTTRASEERGRQGDGASSAPAISPDGGYVTFFSEAINFGGADVNGVPDVFLSELETTGVTRVSISSRGRGQNHSVDLPFEQVSDVSRDGRFVVFDSEANNLVRGDKRGHADVFLRDVRRRRTTRVVALRSGEEVNSDSVYPRITPDGRFVTFESFANNLVVADAPGPDAFLYDRRYEQTILLGLTPSGRTRGRERVRQLLQRPGVSADGDTTVFETTARLVGADRDGRQDAYTRDVSPPAAPTFTVRRLHYRIRSSAPNLICDVRVVGRALRGPCPRRGDLTFLRTARRVRMRVRAFGPGTRLGPWSPMRTIWRRDTR